MITDTAAAGPEMSGTAGVRLYSRVPITPRWLARNVLPVSRRLREDRQAALLHLRRGWLYGPHVDIVARSVPGRPALDWAGIAAALDAGPAEGPTVMDEETYLAQARETGRLEGVAPPYLPMREHGATETLSFSSVETWPQPLQDLREMALDQLDRPLTTTVEQLAEKPREAPVRLMEAFIALAAAHQYGAGNGAFSMRSHAEAFFAWAAARKDPRPAFAQRLAADAPRLRPVVERALSGTPDHGTAAWARAFAYSMGAFDATVAQGKLTLDDIDGLGTGFDLDTMGPPGGDGRVTHEPSAFHRTMDESGVIASPPKWFASYRLLVNLFYQQLPLLGVPPMHRYYFCFAVAELVDDVLGSSWQDRLEQTRQEMAQATAGAAE
ncbi:hypothetical protein [Streptomyces sp. D54]|uniref:hypothetical protein n=1 Tax=Streptomyces sp. D54 TaxID=1290289 RepID=UPI003CF14A75